MTATDAHGPARSAALSLWPAIGPSAMAGIRSMVLLVLVALPATSCAEAPRAAAHAVSVPERGVVSVQVVPDADADIVTVVSVSQPVHGLAQTGPPGMVVYAPATGYTGDDTFTYTLEGARGRLATGTIAVTVLPVNDPPEPRHDLFTITTPEALAGARLDVLWNDMDRNRDPLHVVAVTGGKRGTVTIVEDGAAVVYRAREPFRDVEVFEYTVSDGEREATTWVVVQVTTASSQ